MKTTTCFHAVEDTEVFKRWKTVERQIEATPEDDHEAQWSALQWCGCCCGPSKGEFCTRCQDITPEQYQRLMAAEAEVAA